MNDARCCEITPSVCQPCIVFICRWLILQLRGSSCAHAWNEIWLLYITLEYLLMSTYKKCKFLVIFRVHICCLEVIHKLCNMLRYYVVRPFRFVAVSACGCFSLWPLRSVTVLVCGLSVVAISECGRYDLLPKCIYPGSEKSYGKILKIWHFSYIRKVSQHEIPILCDNFGIFGDISNIYGAAILIMKRWQNQLQQNYAFVTCQCETTLERAPLAI